MDEKNTYLSDLKEIKDLMNKSTPFISLSGISGILAGVYALVGLYFVKSTINEYIQGSIDDRSTLYSILFIATLVLTLAFATGFYLTWRKCKSNLQNAWSASSMKLLINFLIPLVTGGLFTLVLVFKYQMYELAAPCTLIFYGLACVSCSKYTFRDIRYLGLIEIVLGFLTLKFIFLSVFFWALGFGVFHILYGIIMYYKYDRK